MLINCYSFEQKVFSYQRKENKIGLKKHIIKYKENYYYKLFQVTMPKKMYSPFISDFNENNVLRTTLSLYNSSNMNNHKVDKITFKQKDYGYANKMILYIYDLANDLNINNFILEDLDIGYLIDIEIKLRNLYFNNLSLSDFIKSQIFIQLCLTFIYRKDIYKENVNLYLNLYSNDIDYIPEIINFDNLLESERILNNIINYENNNKSIIPSDLFWALSLQEELFIKGYYYDNELINSMIKSYIDIKYDDNIFDYGYRSNKNLKIKKIIDISQNVILKNLFNQNNIILKHFKLILLDKKQGKHLMNYLINTLGYEKIKEMYIENCIIKNTFIENIVDIYLSNIMDRRRGTIKDIRFVEVLIDEHTNNIYLK